MSPQRLLILAALLYLAWRLTVGLIREKVKEELRDQQEKEEDKDAEVEDVLVEDPVCRVLIPRHEAIRLRQDGKTHYFCSDACCDRFIGKPGGTTA